MGGVSEMVIKPNLSEFVCMQIYIQKKYFILCKEKNILAMFRIYLRFGTIFKNSVTIKYEIHTFYTCMQYG